MTGRIPFGLLTLLTALVCLPIQAQDLMGPPSGNGVLRTLGPGKSAMIATVGSAARTRRMR